MSASANSSGQQADRVLPQKRALEQPPSGPPPPPPPHHHRQSAFQSLLGGQAAVLAGLADQRPAGKGEQPPTHPQSAFLHVPLKREAPHHHHQGRAAQPRDDQQRNPAHRLVAEQPDPQQTLPRAATPHPPAQMPVFAKLQSLHVLFQTVNQLQAELFNVQAELSRRLQEVQLELGMEMCSVQQRALNMQNQQQTGKATTAGNGHPPAKPVQSGPPIDSEPLPIQLPSIPSFNTTEHASFLSSLNSQRRPTLGSSLGSLTQHIPTVSAPGMLLASLPAMQMPQDGMRPLAPSLQAAERKASSAPPKPLGKESTKQPKVAASPHSHLPSAKQPQRDTKLSAAHGGSKPSATQKNPHDVAFSRILESVEKNKSRTDSQKEPERDMLYDDNDDVTG